MASIILAPLLPGFGKPDFPPPRAGGERARASVLLSKKSAPFVNGSSLLTESRRSKRSRQTSHRDRG